VKPLKHAENRQIIVLPDSNPVVGHGETPFAVQMLSRDVNAGRSHSAVFNRVADQILKQLDETRIVALDDGKLPLVTTTPLSAIASFRFCLTSSKIAFRSMNSFDSSYPRRLRYK